MDINTRKLMLRLEKADTGPVTFTSIHTVIAVLSGKLTRAIMISEHSVTPY